MRRVIFPFIDDGHPFSADVERFRSQLRVAGQPQLDGRRVVLSEIRGRRLDGGGFVLDRCYCSMQHWSGVGYEFDATSWYYRAGDVDSPRIYHFPDEPYLTALAPYLASRDLDRPDGGLDVLRYVPLRRFTFRAPRRDRTGGAEIGKFKRPSRLHESYGRTTAVAAAVRSTASSFAVATPAGLDVEHAIYFQDDIAGTDLATAAEGDPRALEVTAQVLAAFHAVPSPTLTMLDESRFHNSLGRDLEWITFHAPALADVVDRATRALRDPPALESSVLAHGDFVPSHVLRGDHQLTVIDLDLAHRGDRYRDVAIMLASLPIDAPAASTETTAMIDAYEERAGLHLEPRRLAWHRVAAEAYYLALAFTKDRPIDAAPLTKAVNELEAV